MRESRVGDVVKRFSERYKVDFETGCWNWTSSKNAKGYGLISGEINGKRYAPKGARMLAHRVSWIIHVGEIPYSDAAHGTVIRHKCDNPSCVNPDHLIPGTQADNVRDMCERGRRVQVSISGAAHWNSAFTEDEIEYICSIKGKTKELAEKYNVSTSAIKRVRHRNGLGIKDPSKFAHKPLSESQIEHIRSTKPGTRGLTKLYGISKTAISNIRKRVTYK